MVTGSKVKEFSKIEDELQEKERITERLNNIIDEYRTVEGFTRCSNIMMLVLSKWSSTFNL